MIAQYSYAMAEYPPSISKGSGVRSELPSYSSKQIVFPGTGWIEETARKISNSANFCCGLVILGRKNDPC